MKLTVPTDRLRRHLDLPSWADTATIEAALRCPPPKEEIQAAAAARRPVVRAAAPAPPSVRPLLDAAARVQAASDGELRSLAASALPAADRQAVADELGHRRLLATNFPDLADGARGRARIRHNGD